MEKTKGKCKGLRKLVYIIGEVPLKFNINLTMSRALWTNSVLCPHTIRKTSPVPLEPCVMRNNTSANGDDVADAVRSLATEMRGGDEVQWMS